MKVDMYYGGIAISTIVITNSVNQHAITDQDHTFDFKNLGIDVNFTHNNDRLVLMFEKPFNGRMLVKIHVENGNFDNMIAMNVWINSIIQVKIVEPMLKVVYPE